MKVWATSFDGLVLIGDEGEILVDLEWCKDKMRGKWTCQNVPTDHEIIGFNADAHLMRIGFVCFSKRKY